MLYNLTLFCKSCTAFPLVEDVIRRLWLKAPGFARLLLAALLLLPAGTTSQVENEKMSKGRYDLCPASSIALHDSNVE